MRRIVSRRELAVRLLLVLLCLSLKVTGGGTSLASEETAGVLPAGRRFHARFVVDRIRDPIPSPSTVGVAGTLNRAGPGDGPSASVQPRNTPASRCREGCLQKRSIKDILCSQQRDCSMCWDVCNRNNQVRRENELSHRLLLSLGRMIRNESVVTADIEWTTPAELVRQQPPVTGEPLSRIARDGSVAAPTVEPADQYHQCLVSWEISGGGLTGNLLTETFMVELSLWPNSKYHVHVTCRNKVTDSLIRSASLLVDTSEAVIVSLHGSTTTTTTTTTQTPDVTSQPQPQPQHRRPAASLPPAFWPFGDETDDDGTVQAVAAPSAGTSREILILGAFVALLVLLLLSLTVVLVVRRKPAAPEDRELLIEGRQPVQLSPKIILHV
ncbi:uncharacterized protein LOC118457354 [Anopheles albimanus]|uniref:Fibronectin type-III domain-containing protein n=1 Tax=Anopheles albimanus TaxID=7167 RepID=A0A182FJ26_ANOAL|nr:uncharacterized protein LOC118457354 [Anopheles albimanus]